MRVVARGLTVRYPGWRRRGEAALDAVSLDLPTGSITELRGGNGAGKTTLLLALLGAIAPTSGSIEIDGLPPLRYRRTRGVGFLPARPPAPPGWTGRALIAEGAHLARLRGRRRSAALEAARDRGPPEAAWDRPLATLSTGLLRRLLLAYALLDDPELILLDEPFAGLDAGSRGRVGAALRSVASTGAVVVVATHETLWTDGLADETIVLDQGRRLS